MIISILFLALWRKHFFLEVNDENKFESKIHIYTDLYNVNMIYNVNIAQLRAYALGTTVKHTF